MCLKVLSRAAVIVILMSGQANNAKALCVEDAKGECKDGPQIVRPLPASQPSDLHQDLSSYAKTISPKPEFCSCLKAPSPQRLTALRPLVEPYLKAVVKRRDDGL